MADVAATALTMLPLSTRILITEFSIFENVEKMDDRMGSFELCNVFCFPWAQRELCPTKQLG